MVPGIAERFAGVDPLALATSLLIGATLVDVSPLSTVGALCVAVAPSGPHATDLFRKLLWWGFAMVLVAAAACYFASPAFAP
jgi:Mg2+/citrate symporter